MLTNYNVLIKFFITILTICFTVYLFYLGYASLNLYKSIDPNPSNSKNNINEKTNNYLSESDDADLLYESKN